MAYEDALMLQKCQAVVKSGEQLYWGTVEQFFWDLSPELAQATLEQKGADGLAEVEDEFRETFLPDIVENLEAQGFEITR